MAISEYYFRKQWFEKSLDLNGNADIIRIREPERKS